MGLTPDQKEAISVALEEFNPFAIIIDKNVVEERFEDVSANEQRIRSVFKDLGVSGVTKSGTGYKVLIGDMILREGQIVPSVIPNQIEQLEVLSISDEEMVIGWVENESNGNRNRRKSDAGRKLSIPISRGAKVTPRLPRSVPQDGGTARRR